MGSVIDDSSLLNVSIKNTDFSGARIGMDFSNLDLSGNKFRNVILNHANLSSSNLSNIDFSYASLNSANFNKSLLTNSTLYMADLGAANLSEANLSGANLLKSYIKNTNLEHIITDSNTLTDTCFSNDLINKIQCKISRLTSIGNPPYETTFEHRDNYRVIYP